MTSRWSEGTAPPHICADNSTAHDSGPHLCADNSTAHDSGAKNSNNKKQSAPRSVDIGLVGSLGWLDSLVARLLGGWGG